MPKRYGSYILTIVFFLWAVRMVGIFNAHWDAIVMLTLSLLSYESRKT